jgi:hypothetical protein
MLASGTHNRFKWLIETVIGLLVMCSVAAAQDIPLPAANLDKAGVQHYIHDLLLKHGDSDGKQLRHLNKAELAQHANAIRSRLETLLRLPSYIDQPAFQKVIDFLEEEPGECRIVFRELIPPDGKFQDMKFYRVDFSRAEPIIWRGGKRAEIRTQLNEPVNRVFLWKNHNDLWSQIGQSGPEAKTFSIFWPSMSHSAIAERLSAAFERLRLLCQQQ